MTYGHSNRAPAEDAIVERPLERTAGTWGRYQAWRQLDAEKRLKLIERALGCPAYDLDCFRVAL